MNSAIKYSIPYIIIWGIWFLFHNKVQEELYNPLTIQAFLWSGFVLVGLLLLSWEKYRTPSYIAQDIHGSCFHKPVEVGSFNIRTLGDMQLVAEFRGNDAVVVTDKNLDYNLGTQTFSLAKVSEVSKSQLPVYVQAKIDELGINPKKYYLGIMPLSIVCDQKDLIINQQEFLISNETFTRIYDMHKGDYSKVEDAVEHFGKLADRIDRRNFLAKFFDDFRRPKGPEGQQ